MKHYNIWRYMILPLIVLVVVEPVGFGRILLWPKTLLDDGMVCVMIFIPLVQ